MKILLADDSMTAQNMGKKILTDAGYEVVAVSNGAAAVKKIAEQRPDVAVLDVYMPGYTGLEVCERLKSALDTNHMPVLLTVGRMEPFKPEEGNRVKADGIIIKPFEASDLLAAIQKLEQQMGPARGVVAAVPSVDSEPMHERTQKIRIPYLDEGKGVGQPDWNAAAPSHAAEPGQQNNQPLPAFSVPEAMQDVPAMGIDELEVVPPTEPVVERTSSSAPAPPPLTRTDPQIKPGVSAAPSAAATSTSGVWRALDKARDWFGGAAEPHSAAKPEEIAFVPATDLPGQKGPEAFIAPSSAGEISVNPIAEQAKTIHELAYDKAQSYGAALPDTSALPADAVLEQKLAEVIEAATGRDPQLEMPPSAELEHIEIVAEPDLEPTITATQIPTLAAPDPALVTDNTQLASAFPTRFGMANPDDTPVGIASDYPGLYADAISAAEAAKQSHGPDTPAATSAAGKSADQTSRPATPVTTHEPPPIRGVNPPPRIAKKSGWVAEEAAVEAHENRVKLHDEMHQISQTAPAGEEEVEVEIIEPGMELAEQEVSDLGKAADPQLAAAMAAAVGAQMAPSVTHAVSETATANLSGEEERHTALIADIVDRVTELMKPELIRRIAAELQKKK